MPAVNGRPAVLTLTDGLPERHLEPGEALFRQGEPDHASVAVLVSGSLRVEVDGGRLPDVAVPGSFVGEVGSLLDVARTADVVAAAPTTVRLIGDPRRVLRVPPDPGAGAGPPAGRAAPPADRLPRRRPLAVRRRRGPPRRWSMRCSAGWPPARSSRSRAGRTARPTTDRRDTPARRSRPGRPRRCRRRTTTRRGAAVEVEEDVRRDRAELVAAVEQPRRTPLLDPAAAAARTAPGGCGRTARRRAGGGRAAGAAPGRRSGVSRSRTTDPPAARGRPTSTSAAPPGRRRRGSASRAASVAGPSHHAHAVTVQPSTVDAVAVDGDAVGPGLGDPRGGLLAGLGAVVEVVVAGAAPRWSCDRRSGARYSSTTAIWASSGTADAMSSRSPATTNRSTPAGLGEHPVELAQVVVQIADQQDAHRPLSHPSTTSAPWSAIDGRTVGVDARPCGP